MDVIIGGWFIWLLFADGRTGGLIKHTLPMIDWLWYCCYSSCGEQQLSFDMVTFCLLLHFLIFCSYLGQDYVFACLFVCLFRLWAALLRTLWMNSRETFGSRSPWIGHYILILVYSHQTTSVVWWRVWSRCTPQ